MIVQMLNRENTLALRMFFAKRYQNTKEKKKFTAFLIKGYRTAIF